MNWIIIVVIIFGLVLIGILSYFAYTKFKSPSTSTQLKPVNAECQENDISNYNISSTPILGSELLQMFIKTISQIIKIVLPKSFIEYFALDANTYTSPSQLTSGKYYNIGYIKQDVSSQITSPLNSGASCPPYPSNIYVLAPTSNATCKTLDSDLYGPVESTSVCNIYKYDGWYKNGTLNPESNIILSQAINGGTTCTQQLPLTKIVKCISLGSYVLTNLFVNLDANSYPGSGNTWSDLSSNKKDVILVNSPSYRTAQGGYFHFTDTLYQYGYIPSTLTSTLSKWTIEIWYRITKSLSGRYTSLLTNQFDNVSNINYSIGTNNAVSTNYTINGGFFNGAWRNTSGFAPILNIWYQTVVTYDGNTISQYTNGILQSTYSYAGTVQSGGEIRIARRWDGSPGVGSSNYLDSDISVIRMYSNALTNSQVLQNYNAIKLRFGLP
jgi:hypothetical protein